MFDVENEAIQWLNKALETPGDYFAAMFYVSVLIERLFTKLFVPAVYASEDPDRSFLFECLPCLIGLLALGGVLFSLVGIFIYLVVKFPWWGIINL